MNRATHFFGLLARRKLFYPLLLSGITLITFWNLWDTFYQQDEWLGLGAILADGWSHVRNDFSPLQLLFAEGRPLTRVFGVLFFGNFPLASMPLALYSIFLHALNAILIYFIAQKLLRSKFFSFIAAIFFSVNFVSSQGVTWFGASFGLLPSSFLIFLSILLFIHFLEKDNVFYLYASFISAIISLYFKEHGLFLFLFLPLVYLVVKKSAQHHKFKKVFIPFGSFIGLLIMYRLVHQLIFLGGAPDVNSHPLFISTGKNVVYDLLFRAVLYPLTSLSLLILPSKYLMQFAEFFAKSYYVFTTRTDLFGMIYQTLVLDLIAVFSSFILLGVLIFLCQKHKPLRLPIFFSLLLFTVSLLPYIVINKGFAYLESRYYYISAAAIGILLSTIIYWIYSNKKLSFIIRIVLFATILWYSLYNIGSIQEGIFYQKNIGIQRIKFLNDFLQRKPTLAEEKNVFYISGNVDFFAVKNKVPFQHGFGYSLLVMYYPSGKIPKELLSEGYLWGIVDQGYKQVGNKGFGYFYDLQQLKSTMKKNKIDKKSLTAVYYDGIKKEVRDITYETQRDLSDL